MEKCLLLSYVQRASERNYFFLLSLILFMPVLKESKLRNWRFVALLDNQGARRHSAAEGRVL